jgi:hypothetical protein
MTSPSRRRRATLRVLGLASMAGPAEGFEVGGVVGAGLARVAVVAVVDVGGGGAVGAGAEAGEELLAN